MNTMKKIFGGIEMTWLRVILFAVFTAVITAALLLLPVFSDSPLRLMGVQYDWWILFAILLISNCKKPLEAGLKCFVFFLISQPLIYLLQQPFASIDLLRTYYGRWFIMTLLTFPGGMIAYQILRKEFWSALILAVAGVYLGCVGAGRLLHGVFEGDIAYMIDGLFFATAAVFMGFIFCDGKKRKVYLAIVLVCIALCSGYLVYGQMLSGTFEYEIPREGIWYESRGSFAGIATTVQEGHILVIEHSSNGSGDLTLSNEAGETIRVRIDVKGGKVSVQEIE